MKLAIDCRHETGIGTVVKNLIPHFDRHDTVDRLSLIGNPRVIEAWDLRIRKGSIVPFHAGLYSLSEQTGFPASHLKGLDLLWVPHYNVPVKWLFSKTPCVVTIHDLAHFSKYLRLSTVQKIYAHTFFRLAIGMARQVITDSDFSKRELLGRFTRAKSKTTVIRLAVNHDVFFPDASSVSGTESWLTDEPFILTAASLRPHKNLATLLKAFEHLKRDYRMPHRLVIVGKKEGYKIKGDRYEAGKDVERDVVYTGFIQDDLLRKLYSQASCFVYPSFYEGFGFPPLEAMACGAPVVCSNAASLPEVVGDAALACDPADVMAFVKSVWNVVSSPTVSSELKKKSMERARLFSWADVADHYVKIFQSAIS